MDLNQARAELVAAVAPHRTPAARSRAAHDVLLRRAGEAFGVSPRPDLGLEAVIRLATASPPSDARRSFAVLLVDAIGMGGLVSLRGETGGQIRGFLESALLNPLRRAGYPFDAAAYDKNQFLGRLHGTIDDHLRPPEPSIPRWLHGSGSPPED